jgi:hypothetical protein
MRAGTRGEATIEVHTAPGALYDMVSDVRRMGEWSPECRHCEWIDGATGPAVGARFKGSNQHGLARWSTKPRVVVADPGREFAFVIGHLGHDMTRWSYRFEPAADHTIVTEVDLDPMDLAREATVCRRVVRRDGGAGLVADVGRLVGGEDHRLGGLDPAVVWNRLYFRPPAASRSAFGVAHGPPNALDAPKPTSSSNTIRTFGAPSGGSNGSIGG